MTIVVTSGGFDPVHSGHLDYLEEAKTLGDRLIVLLNSDEWLTRKKGKPFLPFYERRRILQNLWFVDEVWKVNDSDDTVIKGIEKAKQIFHPHNIIFAKGGDRIEGNTPEKEIEGVKVVFGVGGFNKRNSSSDILKDWKLDPTYRIWGKYYELFIDKNIKVKELIVKPFSHTSYQRHDKRNEFWIVSKGECLVKNENGLTELRKHNTYTVPVKEWHQIINNGHLPCHIIEIQYGEETIEEDITRQ